MARGSHTLKHIDFSKPDHSSNTGVGAKGRSRLLLDRRNKKIIVRYYYFNAVKGLSFDKTLEMLNYEFDIDFRTLANVLRREADTITEMRKKKPSLDSLKKQYPLLFHW